MWPDLYGKQDQLLMKQLQNNISFTLHTCCVISYTIIFINHSHLYNKHAVTMLLAQQVDFVGLLELAPTHSSERMRGKRRI